MIIKYKYRIFFIKDFINQLLISVFMEIKFHVNDRSFEMELGKQGFDEIISGA